MAGEGVDQRSEMNTGEKMGIIAVIVLGTIAASFIPLKLKPPPPPLALPAKASCTVTCYTDADTKNPYIVLVWYDKDGKMQHTRIDSDQQADVIGSGMIVTVTEK